MASRNGNGIERSLGRIEGQLDEVLKVIAGHGDRLTKVEKKLWYAGGAIAIVAWTGTLLAELFKR